MPFDINNDRWGEDSIYPYTTHMVNFRSLDGNREWTEYFADIADGQILDRKEAIGHAFELLRGRIWMEPGSIIVYALTFSAPDKLEKKEVVLKIKIEALPPLFSPLTFPLQIGGN